MQILDPGPAEQRSDSIHRLHLCLQGLHFLPRHNVEDLRLLVGAAELRQLRSGELLFKAGDPADTFYFVSRGTLGVWRKKDFLPWRQRMVAEGDYFGENALLSRQDWNATVIAESACDLYALKREAFERVLMRDPDAKGAR